MKVKIAEIDIIYLSYDEPNAEKNYADLLTKAPWAKRVHGVEGSDAAHKACAELSETDRFITVDGDNTIRAEFLQQEVEKNLQQFSSSKKNWQLIFDYHFGGYAKINVQLVTFINQFKNKHNIPLDPVYTGKMLFGIMDLINKNHFPKGSKILVIHTGGLQGIEGMNAVLRKKNLSIII